MTQKQWTNDLEENYEKLYLDSLNGKTPYDIVYFPEHERVSKENKMPKAEVERTLNLRYRLPERLRNILDSYKYAVHYKNTSAVWIVDGRSGMGKSTFAGQQGLYCDPKFSLKNYHWDPDTFLNGEYNSDGNLIKNGLKTASKGDVILFDEAMQLSNRSALSKINRMIVQAMSMIRSKNIFVIFCVNSLFDLDRNLAISRAESCLHVYGKNLYDRGNFTSFYKANDGKNRLKLLYLLGKKFYSYSKPKSNFYSTFPKHSVVDDSEYNRLKDIGVNKFLSGDKSNERSDRYREAFRDLLFWINKIEGYAIQDIMEKVKIGERTLRTLIKEYKEDHDIPTYKIKIN